MVSVRRTITVDEPLDAVVGYLQDFAHAEEWDPGTRSCVRLDDGPVRAGSTWRNISVFKGRETELRYELVRLEPAHLTFRGRNKTATSIDDLTFARVGGRTAITYRADITFHGIAKLADPFLRGEFERLGDEVTRRTMTEHGALTATTGPLARGADSGSAQAPAPYAVSAEFYDILQGETDRRSAERRFGAAAGAATVGIVEVGAGTGIVTEVLLARSGAPIHAVEPSAAMRVGLLTRVAGLGADQRARVTVHSEPLEACGLDQVADLVVCSNVAGVVEPALRRALWRAVAVALVPAGVLLMEPPPAELPDEPTVRDLPPVRVGLDTYTAQVCTRSDRGLLCLTYTYRIERDGEVVRCEQEEFTMWPATADQVRAELRDAGLRVADSAPEGLLRATPCATGSGF